MKIFKFSKIYSFFFLPLNPLLSSITHSIKDSITEYTPHYHHTVLGIMGKIGNNHPKTFMEKGNGLELILNSPTVSLSFSMDNINNIDNNDNTQYNSHKTEYYISLPRLMETINPISRPIPTFHIFSKFHYQRYVTSPFVSRMSYAEYCLWEEKVADIVFSYLGDQRRHWTITIPAFFLFNDAIKSYGTREVIQTTLWITPSVEIGSPDLLLLEDDFLDSKNFL
jgi:hypothetical protein